MDALIYIPVESQLNVLESSDCHVLPEEQHVHAGQQKIFIIISDCATRPALLPPLEFPASTYQSKTSS
jgi:hypothetical protein